MTNWIRKFIKTSISSANTTLQRYFKIFLLKQDWSLYKRFTAIYDFVIRLTNSHKLLLASSINGAAFFNFCKEKKWIAYISN